MTPLHSLSRVSFSSILPRVRNLDWRVAACFAVGIAGVVLTVKLLANYFRTEKPPVSLKPVPRTERTTPYTVTLKVEKKEIVKEKFQASTEKVETFWGGEVKVSEKVIEKVVESIPKVLAYEKDDSIEIMPPEFDEQSLISFRVLGYLFTIAKPHVGEKLRGKRCFGNEIIDVLFENIKEAGKVCSNLNLNLLVIYPSTKLEVSVKGEKYTVLVQDCGWHNRSCQEHFYFSYSEQLVQTVKQLATFIAITGTERLKPESMPILDPRSNFLGSRSVALTYLKYMKQDPQIGIFGRSGYHDRGLFGCLFSQEQIAAVLEKVVEYKILPPPDAIKIRTEEIEDYENLEQFHIERKISWNPKEFFSKDDVRILGLNLQEEAQGIKMQEVVEVVISTIQYQIKQSEEENPMKSRRVYLEMEKFKKYYELGAPKLEYFDLSRLTDDEMKKLWLHRIFQALLDKKFIYKFGVTAREKIFYVQA